MTYSAPVSGDYTWTMTINSLTISKSIKLIVKQIPIAPTEPTEIEQQRVEASTYKICAITDTSSIYVSWYRNGYYQYGTTVYYGDDLYKKASPWMYASSYWNGTEHKCYGRTRPTFYTNTIMYLSQWYKQRITKTRSITWSTFDNEFDYTTIYAGESVTLTCRGESGSTLDFYSYGTKTATSTSTGDDGESLATYEVNNAARMDYGYFYCDLTEEDSSRVIWMWTYLYVNTRCTGFTQPDPSRSELTCSNGDDDFETGDNCTYTCGDGYSMIAAYGESLETTCYSNGYWSHEYSTSIRRTMPTCILQVEPASAKISASKRLNVNCATQDAKDDLWTLVNQKWTDLDYQSEDVVTVELRTWIYDTAKNRCFMKWKNVGSGAGAAAAVKQAKVDQKAELIGRTLSKRDTEDDEDDSSIELECGIGEGADSQGLYCLECPAGSYSTDNECVECPLKSYSTSAGSTTCDVCSNASQGTLTTGSTASTDCVDICTVEGNTFGEMDPPEDYIVESGSSITTYCNAGYSIGNDGNSATHTCGTPKYCSSVTMMTTDDASYSAGQDYTVTCEASTVDPSAEIIWSIDGTVSACDSGTTGECVITQTDSSNKIVSVLSGSAATSATYKCSLSGSESTVEALETHSMTVLTNTVVLSSNVAQVGDTLTVTCSGTDTEATSGDYPTINAFLNGVDIGGDKVDEVLTAEFVVPFSAEVHCTFNYMDVTETKSLDAEDIYEAVFYQAPHYNTKSALDTAVVIVCESNFATTAVWSDDGTESEAVTSSDASTGTTTATLSVTKSAAASVDYWCRATQTVSGTDVTIDTTAVTYTFSESDVMTDPTAQYTDGSEVMFTCVVPSGSTVSWKKDEDTSLDLSDKTSHTSSTDEEYVLTFSSPTIDDQGIYYCTGSGGRSSGAKLNFISITSHPSATWIAKGDSDMLSCVATGDVTISFINPDGDEFTSSDDDMMIVYNGGYTRAQYEYTADDDVAGSWYCKAQDPSSSGLGKVNSDSATITVMDVDLTMNTTVVRDGDSYTATMKVIGYHDGLELFNNGESLTIVTPTNVETDKLSAEGTTYTWSNTLNGTLSDTDYVATVYYDSYATTYTTTVSLTFLGFPSGAPDDVSFVEGTNTVTATVSGPGDMTVDLVKDGEVIVSVTSSEGVVEFSKDFIGADSGTYTVTTTTTDGLIATSDEFQIQVYGAKIAEYSINYPGPADTSSEERITLTCVIITPRLTNVIWYKWNTDTSSTDALAALTQYQSTSWEDEELTSTYQVEIDAGTYYCKTTFDGETISVTYTLAMLDYALSIQAGSAYFDSDLTFTNNVADFSSELTIVVTNSNGAEIDISTTVVQDTTPDFTSSTIGEEYTSNIAWIDSSGLHSGQYETTNTISVAGVYIMEQDQVYAKQGGSGPLTCYVTSTAELTPKQVQFSSNEGLFTTATYDISTAFTSGTSYSPEITYGESVTSATITCTVTFDDDSNDVTKSATMIMTMGVNCTISDELEYGSYSKAVGTSFETGTSVDVECQAGFQLHGQTSYTCSFGDLWDSVGAPECIRINDQCPAITLPDHFMDFRVGSTNLILKCQDSMAEFTDAYSTVRCQNEGWDAVSIDTPVFNYNMCGTKMTPSAKSVEVTASYYGDSGAPFCTTDAEKATAYSDFTTMAGSTAGDHELVSCGSTTDGYTIVVKYTQTTSTLTQLDLLDATVIEDALILNNYTMYTSGRKRRSVTQAHYLGSVTSVYTLECPLSAPSYKQYCVQCPVGTYSDGDQCIKCPKGQYQHIAGSLYCLSCDTGTTAGTGTTTISECGETCFIGNLQNGLTVPPAASVVTDPTSVIVVCDEGYSLPVEANASSTCQDVTYSCNRDCELTTSNVTDDHIDVIAGVTYISGTTTSLPCQLDYETDDGESAIEATCVSGQLSSLSECKKTGLSTGIIVLIVLLVLLALLLLIIIPLCCLMNGGGRTVSDTPDKMEYDVELRPQSSYSCSNHVLIKGSKTDQRIMNSNPFKVSAMNEHIRGMTIGLNEGFIREFRSITVGSDSKKVISQMSENFHKNRYSTITTYDHSRVRLLKINNDPYSDYVNASYINGYVSPNAYIATQGPVQQTVDDYWRMVWEQNVSSIVMLTNLIQKGQMKCHKYWPDNVEQFGVVKVKKMSENKMAGFVVRELEIEVEEKKRTVFQYHYMDWPDVGYPDETKFLSFMYYIRHLRQDSTTPIVVHCSAGAGWTGVFIGLDITLDRLTREDNIDVLGCVNAMRQQRSAMVQNEPQYIYLHKLLLDAVNNYTFNKLRANRFRQNLDGAIFVNPDAPSDDYEGGL